MTTDSDRSLGVFGEEEAEADLRSHVTSTEVFPGSCWFPGTARIKEGLLAVTNRKTITKQEVTERQVGSQPSIQERLQFSWSSGPVSQSRMARSMKQGRESQETLGGSFQEHEEIKHRATLVTRSSGRITETAFQLVRQHH